MIDDPESLIHYTDTSALCSIISQDKLRISDVRFLNDTREMAFGIDTSTHWINEKSIEFSGRPIDENSLRNFREENYNLFFDLMQTFAASFCNERHEVRLNGKLSQWRSYAGESGVAICFDATKLFLEKENFEVQASAAAELWDKVAYGRIHPSVERIVNDVDPVAWATQALADRESASFQDYLRLISKSAFYVKHDGFREEDEFRYTATFVKSDLNIENTLTFFERRGTIVPAIFAFGGRVRNSIRYIMVGPGENRERRAESVRQFLAAHGVDAKVYMSDIPYSVR